MNRYLILAIAALTTFSACNKDDDDTNDDTTNPGTTPTEEPTDLPSTYVVIEGDSFYMSANSVAPDANAYRYQVNFSSAAQLDQTGNDGNTESTLAIVMTFKDKPTQSGSAPFSSSRFPAMGTDSVNFYTSFFINTGHPLESKNFLSPKGENLNFTIANGKLTADLPPMDLINEGDPAETAILNGGSFEIDW